MDWQRLFYRQVLPTEGAGDGGVANGATTTSTTGLSASGTAPSTAGGSKDSETASGRPQAIQFQLADNLRDRIFTLDPSRPPLISWKRTNATQIEEITWFGTSSSGSGSYRDIAVVRGTSVPLLDYDDEADSVRLGLIEFLRAGQFQRYHAHNMVIQITWQDESTDERGSTTSGVFTVVDGSSEEDQMREDFIQQFEQASEEELETLTDGSESPVESKGGESSDPTGNGLRPGVSSTSVPISSASSTSMSIPTAISSNESDSSDNGGGGGGGGGLSTGAIAGIAVAGAVVFLALIGGLVFWMLRRRRRNKDRGHYNQPTNSTTFMGGDKDIHQVTESPHSTYSNDQHVPLSNLAGAGTSRDIGGPSGHHDLHDDDADYAPYRDDDRGAQGSAAGQRTDGAGTPHGVSRSVAHLVEDGMTEDEIRRLEEEERQLDDAIQRHGRSR